jgi:hypothetical protein
MREQIEEIAERLERAADRYHNAADFRSKTDALNAANQVRRARSAMEAQQIEQAFLRSHPPDGGGVDAGQLAGNAGCLGGWFGGGGGRRSGPWRSTTARPGWTYRPGMIRSSFTSGRYHNYTVHQAISRHTPPGYDPDAYARSVAQAMGIAGGVAIGALTAAQVAALADAIEQDPNWRKAPLGSAAEPITTTDTSSSDFAGPYSQRDPSVRCDTSAGYARSGARGGDFAGPTTDNS